MNWQFLSLKQRIFLGNQCFIVIQSFFISTYNISIDHMHFFKKYYTDSDEEISFLSYEITSLKVSNGIAVTTLFKIISSVR